MNASTASADHDGARTARRVHRLSVVVVLALAACSRSVVAGHGTAPVDASTAPGATSSSSPSTRPSPANAFVFRVTGHVGGLTAVLKTDGRAKALGQIRLPFAYRVEGTAKRYALTLTITGGGSIECSVTDGRGTIISDSGAGTTDTGTFSCSSTG